MADTDHAAGPIITREVAGKRNGGEPVLSELDNGRRREPTGASRSLTRRTQLNYPVLDMAGLIQMGNHCTCAHVDYLILAHTDMRWARVLRRSA
jgi:hypothetical protein